MNIWAKDQKLIDKCELISMYQSKGSNASSYVAVINRYQRYYITSSTSQVSDVWLWCGRCPLGCECSCLPVPGMCCGLCLGHGTAATGHCQHMCPPPPPLLALIVQYRGLWCPVSGDGGREGGPGESSDTQLSKCYQEAST